MVVFCTSPPNVGGKRDFCSENSATHRDMDAASTAGIETPIIVPRMDLLKDRVGAIDLRLTADEVAVLEKPYQPHAIKGHCQPSPKERASN